MNSPSLVIVNGADFFIKPPEFPLASEGPWVHKPTSCAELSKKEPGRVFLIWDKTGLCYVLQTSKGEQAQPQLMKMSVQWESPL